MILLNKVETKDNSRSREIGFDNNMCALCGLKEELVSHIFFNCIVA